MKQVFTRAGVRSMRAAWALLALAIIAGAGIVFASHWYHEKEKRDNATSGKRLQEARARVAGARRERDSLQESSDVFRTLVDRGLLQSERRLDLVELVNGLRARHQAVQRRMALAQHEQLQAERVAISLRGAGYVVPRHQALEHPVDLAGVAPHRLDDFASGKPIGLLGQQFQDVQPLVERGGAIAVVRSGHCAGNSGGGLA